MSLVIAFSGTHGAVIAGDMREIFLGGDNALVEQLECELYTGGIKSDTDLRQRAKDLGVSIVIRDNKCKVTELEGVLIGQVCETGEGGKRTRRVYLSAGNYAIVDIEGSSFDLKKRGEGSSFIILGNEVTKAIANQMIREYWTKGTLEDAIRVIVKTMETAAAKTASVSKQYVLLQTKNKVVLSGHIERDMNLRKTADDTTRAG
jgi:hypothetical protein